MHPVITINTNAHTTLVALITPSCTSIRPLQPSRPQIHSSFSLCRACPQVFQQQLRYRGLGSQQCICDRHVLGHVDRCGHHRAQCGNTSRAGTAAGWWGGCCQHRCACACHRRHHPRACHCRAPLCVGDFRPVIGPGRGLARRLSVELSVQLPGEPHLSGSRPGALLFDCNRELRWWSPGLPQPSSSCYDRDGPARAPSIVRGAPACTIPRDGAPVL
jgi:hypothetical protein